MSQTARPTNESAVVVSYHEKSELALPHTAEMELAEIFEHLSHTTKVQTRLLHVLGEWMPTYGSWFPPQFNLIVCVTGPVPGKLPLAGIATELECFFNRQIARRTTFLVHFVLLLDLWIGRQPLRLALTFNDKTTLKIAMWRFVKYLHGDPRAGAVLGEEGYVTLAYPAAEFVAAGCILLLVSFFLLGLTWQAVRQLGQGLPLYDIAGPWPYVLVVALLLPAIWAKQFIIPRRRYLRFLSEFQQLMGADRTGR